MHNRRQFLKKAGLGLGTLSTATYPALNSLFKSNEKKLGVALVGLGNYATNNLRPALLETQYCELKAIVTGTPSKEKEWMEKYGIKEKNIYNYQNFDKIANNPDVDIVYVVLPNSMHADYIIRAARAGKHVICEKPFDVSAKKAAKAVDYCKKMGKLLQIGYRCQYDPHHRELMRVGKEKDLGDIKVMKAEFSFYGVGAKNWRYTDKNLAGGGPVMDVGVYCIQAVRYASGMEPISVSARAFSPVANWMPTMEQTMAFNLEFPNDIVANITTSYCSRGNYVEVSAEKGNFGLTPAYGYGGAQGYIGKEKMGFPKINQQAAQMDAFARNILDKTPVIANGEEGLRDMHIIDAIYKSARKNGKQVRIKS